MTVNKIGIHQKPSNEQKHFYRSPSVKIHTTKQAVKGPKKFFFSKKTKMSMSLTFTVTVEQKRHKN